MRSAVVATDVLLRVLINRVDRRRTLESLVGVGRRGLRLTANVHSLYEALCCVASVDELDIEAMRLLFRLVRFDTTDMGQSYAVSSVRVERLRELALGNAEGSV